MYKLGQQSQIARPYIDHQIIRPACEFHETAAKSFDSLRDLIVADCVLEAYDHRAQIRDRPIGHRARGAINCGHVERGSQFDRSEEHTSELQSLMRISYAVFCLNKKTTPKTNATKQEPMHTNTTHHTLYLTQTNTN